MKSEYSDLKFKIYARKSSESEDRQVQSIDDQISRLKRLASEMGLTIVGEPLVEAKSAKAPDSRPVFKDLLERIEAGEANAILCWQLNRLSRNPIDSARVQWHLQRGVLKVIQTFDRVYRPEDNVLIFSVDSGMSNQYCIDLSKNAKRGMQSKLEKGWFCAIAPQGYMNDTVTKTIVPDPERFDLIRKMWDYMLKGIYTPPVIQRMANNKWGYRTRRFKRIGGEKMSRSAIYKIFTNPFYFGVMRWNGKEYPGSHKPMVTLDEFNRVQKLLGEKARSRSQNKAFAFTGFIHCGDCGCQITAEDKFKNIQSNGEVRKYVYYHCTHRKPNYKCSQTKNIRVEEMERQFVENLRRHSILPQFREWALEELRQTHEKEVRERGELYRSQKTAVDAAQVKLDGLMDLRLGKLISNDEFLNKKAVLSGDLQRLKESMDSTGDRMARSLELEERAFNFITYAPDSFQNSDMETQKCILLGLGSNWSILNGKQDIKANSWVRLIAEEYPPMEAEYLRLEPTKTIVNKERTASLEAVRMGWLGR